MQIWTKQSNVGHRVGDWLSSAMFPIRSYPYRRPTTSGSPDDNSGNLGQNSQTPNFPPNAPALPLPYPQTYLFFILLFMYEYSSYSSSRNPSI